MMQAALGQKELCSCGQLLPGSTFPLDAPFIDPVVQIDSRLVEPGGIFIALKGERTDGHRFVEDVVARGALLVMVERGWYQEAGMPEPPENGAWLVVDDTVEGLQRLATAYRRTFDIPLVAIGGSNGKTTTKEMVGAVLGTGYAVHMSQGNFNNHLGVPLTLLGMRSSTAIAVIEMGINHPGEMEELAAIAEPTHGLLTNIGHEHLEFLGDLDGVARAECRLYEYLDRRGGTMFVNQDDERLANEAGSGANRIRYGSGAFDGACCHADEVVILPDGRIGFTLVVGHRRLAIRLAFPGRHNVINAVAAAAVGLHFGLSPEQIREGLEALLPSPGWKRLELLEAGGVRLINDTYNANPDSVRLAIDTLCDTPCSGRRIAVIGDMLELGEASAPEHRAIGSYFRGLPVEHLFTLGDYAGLVCEASGMPGARHFSSREALADALARLVRAGDVVLLKGSRGMRLELVAEALVADRPTLP